MPYLKKIKGFLAMLLLICWAALLTNNFLYWHGHHLANGRTIWHAHPYKKSSSDNPFPNHKHADWELILLNTVATFLIPAAIFFAFALSAKLYAEKNSCAYKFSYIFATYLASLAYRGPPYRFSA